MQSGGSFSPSWKKGHDGAEFEQIGCVIMASGMGRRFGGNKLMADLNGVPMIEYILSVTDALFGRRVVVTRHGEIAAYCRSHRIEVVLHDLPYRSDTVRLGIECMDECIRGCMFCPSDQPLLKRESLRSLCAAFSEDVDGIFQLCWAQEIGTPVLFPRSCFAVLACLPEGKGGNVLLKRQPERVRHVSAQDPWEMRDVDTPKDLEDLRKQIAADTQQK